MDGPAAMSEPSNAQPMHTHYYCTWQTQSNQTKCSVCQDTITVILNLQAIQITLSNKYLYPLPNTSIIALEDVVYYRHSHCLFLQQLVSGVHVQLSQQVPFLLYSSLDGGN